MTVGDCKMDFPIATRIPSFENSFWIKLLDSIITTISLRQYHYDNIITTVSLRQYHYDSIITTISLRQYHYDSIITTISLRQYHYDGIITTVSLRWMWSITKPLHRSKSKIEKSRTDPLGSKLTKPNPGKSSWNSPPPKEEMTWKIASLNTCRLLFRKMLKLSDLSFLFFQEIWRGVCLSGSYGPVDTIFSEWLLFNANSAIFQLYNGENKLIFIEMMMKSALF
jgi:hypothetical protein